MRRNIIFVFAFYIAILCVPQYATAQSYMVPAGEVYHEEGIASWYGAEFDGRPTASGEIFNSTLFTAAHPSLPFGTFVIVTNRHNNRQVTVKINDRGPFVASRSIDLSRAAAEHLDMIYTGTAPVIIETLPASYLQPPLELPAYTDYTWADSQSAALYAPEPAPPAEPAMASPGSYPYPPITVNVYPSGQPEAQSPYQTQSQHQPQASTQYQPSASTQYQSPTQYQLPPASTQYQPQAQYQPPAPTQYQPQAQYQPPAPTQYQPQPQYQPPAPTQYQPQAQYQPPAPAQYQPQPQYQVQPPAPAQYQPQPQYQVQPQAQYQPQPQYQVQPQYQPQPQIQPQYQYQSPQPANPYSPTILPPVPMPPVAQQSYQETYLPPPPIQPVLESPPPVAPPMVPPIAPPLTQSLSPQPSSSIVKLTPAITPLPGTNYRLQVGSYKAPRNAVDAFDKLKGAGLSPAYEQNGEFYRVVLAGIPGTDVPSVVDKLGRAGFREAIIRVEP
jgi:rare lipoprotein A (peptidoglycan hydrolase)